MNAKAEKQENTRCHVGQAEASVFSSLEWAPCSVGLTGFWRRMDMDVPCEMENDDEMTIVNRGHLAPTPDKGAEPWRRVSQGSGLVGEAGGRGGLEFRTCCAEPSRLPRTGSQKPEITWLRVVGAGSCRACGCWRGWAWPLWSVASFHPASAFWALGRPGPGNHSETEGI